MSSPAYLVHASLQSSSNSMKPRWRASSSACLQIKSGMSDGPMTNPFRWHKADGCDRARRCLRRHTGSAPPRCESPHLPASFIAIHVPSSRPTPDTRHPTLPRATDTLPEIHPLATPSRMSTRHGEPGTRTATPPKGMRSRTGFDSGRPAGAARNGYARPSGRRRAARYRAATAPAKPPARRPTGRTRSGRTSAHPGLRTAPEPESELDAASCPQALLQGPDLGSSDQARAAMSTMPAAAAAITQSHQRLFPPKSAVVVVAAQPHATITQNHQRLFPLFVVSGLALCLRR